jgi:hypothetical protein
MIFLNCLLFFGVIFALLDPAPNTDPLTGSETLVLNSSPVADTGQKLLLEDEMEELVEVQNKYERERRTRMMLEEKVR